jgi:CubicO group peptidase (beta-lactamase class C family)
MKKIILMPFLMLSGFLLFAHTSRVSAQVGKNLATRIEDRLDTLLKEWKIPGISFCLIKDGELVLSRGQGVKNVLTGEPVNNQTIFQAASMSKPVFAYAVLKMCDEGLIDLDKPLINYVPQEFIEKTFLGHSMNLEGFKKDWFSKITARMCLSHSSGLQHFGLKKPVELLFEPGTQFYYSSNGIEYLRYVVEHLKGCRIDTLISEYVLKPLQMTSSSFSWRDEYELNSAPGHDKYGQTTGSIDKYSYPTAQASLYTNASDYGKFLSAVLKGKDLKKTTYNEMLKPQIQANPGVFWGLGFGLETAPTGKGIWHWGDGGTHTSYFYCDLDHKSGFAYFVNSYYGLAILEDVFSLLSEGEHPALSFTIGDWSFRDDYLSPSMKFQNKFFNGQTDSAIAFYRHVATYHKKGLQFIDEVTFQSWATDLLRKNNFSDAVTMLQLLIEVYYAHKADTCRALAYEFNKTKSNEAVAEYLETVRKIIKFIHFHWTEIQFEWILNGIITDLKPVTLDENTLSSYAGIYDPFKIIYENGNLFFITPNADHLKMIPMDENKFMFKEPNYFRIQIEKENNNVVALKGIWCDGRTKIYKKTK